MPMAVDRRTMPACWAVRHNTCRHALQLKPLLPLPVCVPCPGAHCGAGAERDRDAAGAQRAAQPCAAGD